MPKVSIVTRTKDRPILLERAIQSVLSQSFENWEHIIINNNKETEKSFEDLIEKYSSQYKNRLKIIKNSTNLDFDPSISIGFDAAKGDYVTIHDDDDSWQKDFLQKTVSFLEKNPKFGAVETYSNYFIEEILDNKVKIHQSYPYESLSEINLYNVFSSRKYPSPIATLFRTKCTRQIGPFNIKLLKSGDREFLLRFLKKYEIAVLREYLANYHARPYNQSIYANSTLGNNSHQDNIFWEKKLKEELFRHNCDLWIYYNLIEIVRPHLEKNTIKKVLKKCYGQKIALYGAGILANDLAKIYKKEFKKLNIVAVFDQNIQKHGTYFEEIPILPPEKIIELKPEKILLTVANTGMIKAFLEKLIEENNLQCEIVTFQ